MPAESGRSGALAALLFRARVRRRTGSDFGGIARLKCPLPVNRAALPRLVKKLGRYPQATEDKVRAIAQMIACDPDELLALAGRMSSDLARIIKRAPVEVAALLRTTSGMARDELARLASEARKTRDDGTTVPPLSMQMKDQG